MGMMESLEKRRSYYHIDSDIPVDEDAVIQTIEKMTALVPDAYDMKSARVVVAMGEQNARLWDTIYDAFGGKVARAKIDAFAAGAGTVLYFCDTTIVEGMQEKFPRYAANFPIWANQANGMLQLSIWTALSELGIGANLQHYNPVIDDAVKALFDIPASYQLVAQMPFGGIVEEPAPKAEEDISLRVSVRR